MKPELEVWTSTHSRVEKHYFIKTGEQNGYQLENAYLCGINPDLVPPETEKQILELIYQKLNFGRLD